MKIRAIRLTNIRRFAAQTAAINGLADGITVIAAPNEQGKSTFFDALHAAFFQKHSSQSKEVKSLRPHAGGSPEVAVEIETAAGRFRVEKRFLAGKFARVTDLDSGRLLAQADEAEAWLGRLVIGDGGPSGLLWVRQGAFSLQPDGASEQAQMLDARKTLLSSVAGEVDAMTGGRRMDAVQAAVSAALARLTTATGRPRADGPWHLVQKEHSSVAEALAKLTRACDDLRAELDERSRITRDLAQAQDPADATRRADRLRAATDALQAAEAQARNVEAARTTRRLAEAEERALGVQLTALHAAETQAQTAATAHTKAAEAATEAAADLARLTEAEAHTTTTLTATTVRHQALTTALDAAHQAREAQTRATRLTALQTTLNAAESARTEAEAARAAAAALRVDARAAETAERLEQACALARARRDAGVARLVAWHSGDQRFGVNGQPLADGTALPLQGTVEVTAPGLGRLVFTAGTADGTSADATLTEAETRLRDHLATWQADTAADLRARLTARTAADQRARAATDRLALLAPEGIDPLRAEVAGLAILPQTPPAAPADPAALRTALAEAAAALTKAQGAVEAARTARTAASERAIRAQAALETALRDHRTAEDRLGAPEAHRAKMAEVQAELAATAARVQAARAAHDLLSARLDDLATLRADLERATSALRAHDLLVQRLTERRSHLSGQIATRAEEGVEAARDEAAGRLEALAARDARYAAEVAGLLRLKAALDTARSAARERYFEPVRRELDPLLRILHDAGEVVMDDATLLPRALVRGGVPEAFDILSGGTREQIAVLTRLAFARLLARTGEAVPVVLDDALVFSDDDRIERMFTALHRVAQGQQIIVFTCRQRAFQALGGEWPQIVVTNA